MASWTDGAVTGGRDEAPRRVADAVVEAATRSCDIGSALARWRGWSKVCQAALADGTARGAESIDDAPSVDRIARERTGTLLERY